MSGAKIKIFMFFSTFGSLSQFFPRLNVDDVPLLGLEIRSLLLLQDRTKSREVDISILHRNLSFSSLKLSMLWFFPPCKADIFYCKNKILKNVKILSGKVEN